MKIKRIGPNIMGRADGLDDNSEMEECVKCHEITDVPKDLHIDFRKTYVEGVGQLCAQCYNQIYNTKMP